MSIIYSVVGVATTATVLFPWLKKAYAPRINSDVEQGRILGIPFGVRSVIIVSGLFCSWAAGMVWPLTILFCIAKRQTPYQIMSTDVTLGLRSQHQGPFNSFRASQL